MPFALTLTENAISRQFTKATRSWVEGRFKEATYPHRKWGG